MSGELKLHQYIISGITILLCLVLIPFYGWTFYAVATGRPGYNGSQYIYYDLTRAQFAAYNFIVAFFSVCYIIVQAAFVVKRNTKYLIKLYWIFLLFILSVISCEVLLNSRFVPKG